MAAFLAHETCAVSGEIYTAGAGRFARLFLASTPGYVHAGTAAHPRPKTSRSTGRRSTTRAGYFVPADLMDWSRRFLSHLDLG